MSLPKPYYQDDAVCIYHADCRNILPELPKVDLVLTDPPYGLNTRMQGGTWGIKYANGDIQQWDFLIDKETISRVKEAGNQVIMWGANYYYNTPSRCWLIWDKLQKLDTLADFEMAWTNLNKPCKSWTEKRNHAENGNQHLTQKPISLMEWCILQATNPQLILDPFMGSGTTLVAAQNLGRKSIGIEIEERYCEIAVKRLQQKPLPLTESMSHDCEIAAKRMAQTVMELGI